jgi:hypothetical protein
MQEFNSHINPTPQVGASFLSFAPSYRRRALANP